MTENVCLRVRPTHSITAHWLCDPGQVPNFSVLIFSFSKWDHDHLPCGIIAIVETMYTRQSAAWHIVSRCITSRASYSYLVPDLIVSVCSPGSNTGPTAQQMLN